jgi:hypothetical protein
VAQCALRQPASTSVHAADRGSEPVFADGPNGSIVRKQHASFERTASLRVPLVLRAAGLADEQLLGAPLADSLYSPSPRSLRRRMSAFARTSIGPSSLADSLCPQPRRHEQLHRHQQRDERHRHRDAGAGSRERLHPRPCVRIGRGLPRSFRSRRPARLARRCSAASSMAQLRVTGWLMSAVARRACRTAAHR